MFYHLPTRGRAGIKLGDAWYVSNVSVIFVCSMLLYILFWMFNGLYYTLLYYFWDKPTNLRPSANYCSLPISVFRKKGISNGVQTEWNLRESHFWKNCNTEDLEYMPGSERGGHEGRSAPRGVGTPPPSWTPRGSPDVPLPPIYTYVPWKHRGAPQNPNLTAATLCTCEIPSWGLFRSSTGGGIDHGGLLHQHHSLSDELWVYYHRPSGHSY